MKIIRDTREQTPWEFFGHDVTDQKLPCGDYTTLSLLGKCSIERKASTSELHVNLCSEKEKTRFYKELDKLKKLDSAIILCEFPESYIYQFPQNSGIPEKLWCSKRKKMVPSEYMIQVSGKYLRKLIADVNTHIPVIFCNDKQSAEEYALKVFRVWETKYGQRLS